MTPKPTKKHITGDLGITLIKNNELGFYLEIDLSA
tara:strand:+ start:924 stop:1028 length:105 start_codon:yes stop_codon:yes gene_type:complete